MKYYEDGAPIIPRDVMQSISTYVRYMHDDKALRLMKQVLDEEIKTFGVAGSHPHILWLAERVCDSIVGERHISSDFLKYARAAMFAYVDQLAPEQPQLAAAM